MTSEKYFIPVKDLINDETKQYLQKKFWEYEPAHMEHQVVLNLNGMKRHWNNEENILGLYGRKNYINAGITVDYLKEQIDTVFLEAKRWVRLSEEKFRADIIGLFLETSDLSCSKEYLKQLLNIFEEKYVFTDGYVANTNEGADNAVWGRFHTSLTNVKLFENTHNTQEICDLYGSDDWCFLHTSGPRTSVAKHVDPMRQATLTFPLEPELPIYRNLNYYDSFDDEEPAHVVDYHKLDTCVLLNNQEIHSIEDNDPSMSGKPTLCFQLNYFRHTYEEAKKMLTDKGLLIDV